MAEADLPPEVAFELCEGLSNPSARGDCGLAVAIRSARQGVPGQWCERMEDGTWRQECYFQSAESLRRAGRRADAAAMCLRSGSFRDDCGQHLWQTPLHALLQGRGVAAFGEALPRARRLYGEWGPLLSAHTDFDHRFWRRFYQDGYAEAPPPFDLAPCDALAAVDQALCQRHALEIYQARVRQLLGSALCEIADAAAAGRYRHEAAAAADPRVDAAFAEERARLCDGRGPKPL